MQQYGAMQALLLTVQAGAVVHPVARVTEIAALHMHNNGIYYAINPSAIF